MNGLGVCSITTIGKRLENGRFVYCTKRLEFLRMTELLKRVLLASILRAVLIHKSEDIQFGCDTAFYTQLTYHRSCFLRNSANLAI